MIVRQSNLIAGLRAIRARANHHIDRIIPPKHDIEYESESWHGPVSIIESGEAVGLEGSPVSVSIPPERLITDTLYEPEINGTWHSYLDRPHPLEAAEPADILDLSDLGVRPLFFEHQVYNEADPADQNEWDRVGLQRRFRLYASSSAMLRHSQPARDNPAVDRFLGIYTDINEELAWYLQPTHLGLNIPFKYWPHCVWVDYIGEGLHRRVFCQALTHNGHPLSLATSWPVNTSGLRAAQLELLDDTPVRGL
ncbi:hypothetical protein [uncultured Ruegeria sp.]|uniref:hypothetical protein n=1 Tax=uncultured Ruegeria sp. TaxID=259304 RepID=UPI0026382599|nr:hypothetical protein [uncultured Ruegeria sp.]